MLVLLLLLMLNLQGMRKETLVARNMHARTEESHKMFGLKFEPETS